MRKLTTKVQLINGYDPELVFMADNKEIGVTMNLIQLYEASTRNSDQAMTDIILDRLDSVLHLTEAEKTNYTKNLIHIVNNSTIVVK